MEAGKLADRVRVWIDELPARQREVVLLRGVEGMSITGRLAPEDLTPQMQDEFVDLYRRWRSEQP